jgi:hypothetical protein
MEADDIIYAHYHQKPEIGQSFHGACIRQEFVKSHPDGWGTISTSPVTDIQEKDGRTVITTVNSRYEVIDDSE